MLAFFPASATGTTPGSVEDKNDVDSFIAKIDHQISSTESLNGRYAFARSQQVFPQAAWALAPDRACRSLPRLRPLACSWFRPACFPLSATANQ
jgi:hypothetical protein